MADTPLARDAQSGPNEGGVSGTGEAGPPRMHRDAQSGPDVSDDDAGQAGVDTQQDDDVQPAHPAEDSGANATSASLPLAPDVTSAQAIEGDNDTLLKDPQLVHPTQFWPSCYALCPDESSRTTSGPNHELGYSVV